MVVVDTRHACVWLWTLLTLSTPILSQTSSTCNPLTQGGCPADPALGKSVTIDFTQGASSSFTNSGGEPTYGSNGAEFTIAQSGDSPTLSSKWYMMFGHVDFVLKAAPGTGIVSSAILISDDLDEIDWEWLGGDDTQVQSNYFGKGETVSGYNRGAFHAASNNHDQFYTYSIDWTANQIVWQINGQTVRVLTPATAEANQYPQTPMMVKVGIWAGGDPANAPGTIQWAGGQTDYTKGPYSMYVKSIKATDYSTGTSYSYSGTSGTWNSIVANGGSVNSNGNGAVASQSSPPVISTASGAPMPLTTDAAASSVYATRTGWPWVVATASIITTTSKSAATSYSGLPSGWSVNSSGKVVPPSTGSDQSPSSSSSSLSASVSSSASEVEVTTSYDSQGQPTVLTITAAVAGSTKSYGPPPFQTGLNSSSNSTITQMKSTSVLSTGTTSSASITRVAHTTPAAVPANDSPNGFGVPCGVWTILALIFIINLSRN